MEVLPCGLTNQDEPMWRILITLALPLQTPEQLIGAHTLSLLATCIVIPTMSTSLVLYVAGYGYYNISFAVSKSLTMNSVLKGVLITSIIKRECFKRDLWL